MRKNGPMLALAAIGAAAVLAACGLFLGRIVPKDALTVRTVRTAPPDTQVSAAQTTAAAGPDAQGKLNLNTATLQELLALPGVGEKTAARILAYREEYGRFVAVEQLMDVDGIGEKQLAQLRELVYVEAVR